MRNSIWLLTAVILVGAVMPATAQSLEIIDQTTSPASSRVLTFADLDALPQATIATSTAWTDGVVEFSGPAGEAIAGLGAGAFDEVVAVALNDYQVAIPRSDFEDGRIVLTTRMNGEPMPVRDRGPYWIMYRFDDMTPGDRQVTEARSIWQLKSLTFRAN